LNVKQPNAAAEFLTGLKGNAGVSINNIVSPASKLFKSYAGYGRVIVIDTNSKRSMVKVDTCNDCGELVPENIPAKKWKKPIEKYYCKARKGKERKPTEPACMLFKEKAVKTYG